MRNVGATAVVLVIACGGGSVGTGAALGGPEPAAGVAARAPSGVAHEVRMLVTPQGEYVFQPAELSIRRGDRVRWINVSGMPHNVAFYPDRVPAGAAGVLNAAMPARMAGAELAGRLLFEANEVYEIRFDGAPAGRYEYYCTPHEMLGMTASLTVTS